jgi:hypothetical protein
MSGLENIAAFTTRPIMDSGNQGQAFVPSSGDITRTRVDGPAFSRSNTVIGGNSRLYYIELILTRAAYALSLGPDATFDEMLIDLSGQVPTDNVKYGPLPDSTAIQVSARRPWIGYLPPGKYVAYVKRPMMIPGAVQNTEWFGVQSRGDTFVATGDGAITPMVITGTKDTPCVTIDLIAYHHPAWLATLPRSRNPRFVSMAYINDNNVLFQDATWANGVAKTLRVHADGRAWFWCNAGDFDNATTAQWQVDVYGITFHNAGDAVYSTRKIIMTQGPEAQMRFESQRLRVDCDGYEIVLTRTINVQSNFRLTACVSDD